jgi:hypothetical protein
MPNNAPQCNTAQVKVEHCKAIQSKQPQAKQFKTLLAMASKASHCNAKQTFLTPDPFADFLHSGGPGV